MVVFNSRTASRSLVPNSPLARVSSGINRSAYQIPGAGPSRANRESTDAALPTQQRVATSNKFNAVNDLGSFSDRQNEYTRQEIATREQQQQKYEPKTSVSLQGDREVQQQPEWQPTGNGDRDSIVKSALSLVGTPYELGGNVGQAASGVYGRKVAGVDCSGLTSFAYRAVGINLPRHSRNQTQTGYRTSVKNAQPGDIIGWNQGGGVMGHVAIYLGNGMMVEAAKPGTKARVVPIWNAGSAFAVHLNI